VGISRARERARIYTDDAELLVRRVEDSHSRKAAVELEGLREELAKAGFTRARTAAPSIRPESPRVTVSVGRAWRQMRALRAERLAPAQRLAQRWTQSLRHWIGHRLGLREQVAQRVTEQMRPDSPRQSHGMRM
jgi:hypothetical protein